MFDNHVNLLSGTVQIAPVPSTTGTALTLMPGDDRFQPNMPVTISPPNVEPKFDNSEICYVTDVSGAELTVVRKQEDSTRMQIAAGWIVRGTLTAKTITDLEDSLDSKVDKVVGKGLSTEDYTTAEQSKLAGIAPGATQNDTDASLRDRTTHTGSQAISTVTGLQTALDAKADALSLATVATSGSYDDLTSKPTIPDTSNLVPNTRTVNGQALSSNVTVTKSDVGLGNADNTSDLAKPISTATQTALNAKQNTLGYTPEDAANKGQAGGYASLDGGGKVPVAQLPSSIMEYKGTWNASANTPTLTDGTGNTGDVYRVSVAGSRNLGSGSIAFDVGDYVIFNGSTWEKSDTTDAVASVAGKTGNVVLDKSDVGLSNVDNTSDATKNAAAVTLTNKTLTSPQLNGAGVNTPTNGTIALTVDTGDDANKGIVAFAHSATQAANILEVQDAAFTPVFTVDKAGNVSASTQITQNSGKNVVDVSTTQTLTNKRVSPRVITTAANTTTYTINTDVCDVYLITGQSFNISSITTTGTPTAGQTLLIGITGTATKTVVFSTSSFSTSSSVNLPNQTNGTARTDFRFIWDAVTSRWRVDNELYTNTYVSLTNTQTLSAKTLTAPVFTGDSQIATTGTLALYNVGNASATDYERARHFWSGNVYNITAEAGGTGTFRNMAIGASGSTITLGANVTVTRTSTGVGNIFSVAPTSFTSNSANQSLISMSTTIQQSGTASYTALLVNVTESTTGSGGKLLTDLQVGGTSKFKVDNAGSVTQTGGSTMPLTSKTANYTLTASDYTVLFDATSGALTAALPAAASHSGRVYNIKKTDAVNNVVIDPNGSETIDGATTYTLTAQYQSITIQSNGTNWVIL